MSQKILFMKDVPPHINIVKFIGQVDDTSVEGRTTFISIWLKSSAVMYGRFMITCRFNSQLMTFYKLDALLNTKPTNSQSTEYNVEGSPTVYTVGHKNWPVYFW